MSLIGGILASLATSLISGAVSKGFKVSNSDGSNAKEVAPNPEFGSAIGKIGSTIGSSAIESFNRKKEEERKYARELEKWKMQNAYNHPKEQVARLVEAGLNPALAYGGANAGNASSVGDTNSAPFSGDQMDLVGSALQARQTESNIRIQETQSRLAEEDIELRRRQQYTEEIKQDNARLDSIIKDMEGKKGTKEYEILAESAEEIKRSIKLKNDALEQNIIESQANTFRSFMQAFHEYQQGLTSRKSREVMDNTIKEIASRIGLNNSQTKHFLQLATNEHYVELKEKYNAELRKLGIDPENHGWTGQLGRAVVTTFQYVAQRVYNDATIPISEEDAEYFAPSSSIDNTKSSNWTPPRPRYTTPPYRAVWK